ncbi:MAG: KH domain-containing protein [Solobacterium sp.]|nr:KH domain-containing protein [Solobacterium sp.]
MAALDRVLFDLISPIVENPQALEVRVMESESENEVVLHVYAENDDIARLIGKKGSMASALRQVMSVASHAEDKKITIKFEQM